MNEQVVELLAKLGRQVQEERDGFPPSAIAAHATSIQMQRSIEQFAAGHHGVAELMAQVNGVFLVLCRGLAQMEGRIEELERRISGQEGHD